MYNNGRYDVNDAITAHQQLATRLFTTNTAQFFRDYFLACERYSDDPPAKAFHQHHVAQLESARSLLTTQRILRSSAMSATRVGVSGEDGPSSPMGIASMAVARSACSILRPDWGKEQYKKLSFHWNNKAHEMSFLATESLLAWITHNEQYDDATSIHEISPTSMYNSKLGVAFFQWADMKDAKNYVNALHLAGNAPTSRFFTPFAFAMELVGVPVVAMSVAPVVKLWSNWESCPFLRFHLDAICTSLRFIFTSFPRIHRAEGVAGGSNPSQLPTTEPVEREGCRYAFAVGEDSRWYILDARPLALRQLHARSTSYGGRIPRREMFSLAGAVSTPYSPSELVIKFKLRALVEQLLNIISTTSTGIESTPLLSSLLHAQGVSFGSTIFALYSSICEHERQFVNTIQAANRRNAMNQAAQQHIRHFGLCKSLVLSEMVARVVKRLIREDWRPILLGKKMKKDLVDATLVNDDAADDMILRELNTPLRDSINRIIGGMFLTYESASMSIRGAASGNFSLADTATLSNITGGGGGGATRSSKFGSCMIDPQFFDDIVFMINDSFVSQVYGNNEDVIAELKAAGCAPLRKIDCKVEEIDAGRVLFCLEQMLNISIISRGNKLVVDPKINFFEPFFDLDSTEKCPLRTPSVYTGIDVPLCCLSGSRAKVAEFRSMQERVTAKFQSTIDVSQRPEQVLYLVNVVRFMSIYTYDVMIAHRGYAVDDDYDDTRQIPARVPFPTSIASQQANGCFEAWIALRLSHFYSKTDMQRALKHLLRYTESTRPLFESPTGTSFAVADKVLVLCEICEAFKSPGLVTALDTAIYDISQLMSENTRSVATGVVAVGNNSTIAAASATGNGPSVTPTADALKPRIAPSRFAELRIQHMCHLLLLPLALLVKHILLPDPSRPESERIDQAVRYCIRRRNIIADVYGHDSVEHGIACNDIASICSNNKHDLDRAQVEFERAVEILEKVQGDGATLQIITNNLAFLFFRKAERLKKQLTTEFTLISASERRLKRAEMLSLLNRAENFLTGVMAHEANLPILDFAAAVNNLASIKLFDGRYKEAKGLFEKTLDITASLQEDRKEELPCRSHAFRNLKVLARRQYLAAVMSVQACVRRFIAKIRSRESFRKTKAIKPIQFLGRGYLVRLFLAKHYCFSGFHSWLRQPRLFTRKLDPTLATLPLHIRRSAFDALCAQKATLLHRILRGSLARQNLGKIFNFCRAHFTVRWFAVVDEIHKRRAASYMAQILRWKLLFACEQYLVASSILIRSIYLEQMLRRETVSRWEEAERVQLLFREERSLRLQHGLQRDGELHMLSLIMKRREVEAAEEAARCRSYLAHTRQTEEVFRPMILREEQLRHVQLIFQTQRHRLECVEQTLRNHIVLQGMSKFIPLERLYIIFRVGRGFIWRKWCNAMVNLHEREEYKRRTIETEEAMTLNRSALRRQLLVCRVEDEEAKERRNIAKKAGEVFDRSPNFRHVIPLKYEYFSGRVQISLLELSARRLKIVPLAERELFLLSSIGSVLSLVAQEAIGRKQLTAVTEDASYLDILQRAERDRSNRLHTLHQFWFAKCVSDERRARHYYETEMSLWYLHDILEVSEYLAVKRDELTEFVALQRLQREHFVRTRNIVQRLEQLREERLHVEGKEQQARLNVVYTLEIVARSHISDHYVGAQSTFLLRSFASTAVQETLFAMGERGVLEKHHQVLIQWTFFLDGWLDLQEMMERIAIAHVEREDFVMSIQRSGQENLSLVKLRLQSREKATRFDVEEVDWVREKMYFEVWAAKLSIYVAFNKSNIILAPQRVVLLQREAEQRTKLEAVLQRKQLSWIDTYLMPEFFASMAKPWLHYGQILLESEIRKRERQARIEAADHESIQRRQLTVMHHEIVARRFLGVELQVHTAMFVLLANHSIFVRETLLPAFDMLLRKKAAQFFTSIGRQKQWNASLVLQKAGRGFRSRMLTAKRACIGVDRFLRPVSSVELTAQGPGAVCARRKHGAHCLATLQRVGRGCRTRRWMGGMLHADESVVANAKRLIKQVLRGFAVRRKVARRQRAFYLLGRVAQGMLVRYRLSCLVDDLLTVAEFEAQGRSSIAADWLQRFDVLMKQARSFSGNKFLRARANQAIGGIAPQIPLTSRGQQKRQAPPPLQSSAPSSSSRGKSAPALKVALGQSSRTVQHAESAEALRVAPPLGSSNPAPPSSAAVGYRSARSPSDKQEADIVASSLNITPLHFRLSEDGINTPHSPVVNSPIAVPFTTSEREPTGSITVVRPGSSSNLDNMHHRLQPQKNSKEPSPPPQQQQQQQQPQLLHRNSSGGSVHSRLYATPAWQSAQMFSGKRGWANTAVPQSPVEGNSHTVGSGGSGALAPSAPSEPRPATAPRDRQAAGSSPVNQPDTPIAKDPRSAVQRPSRRII